MASIYFDGIEELTKVTRDLGVLADGAKPLARLAIQKTCADIKADAVEFAPYRHGDLRNSITYETRETATAVIGEVGPSVEYGAYQEFGVDAQTIRYRNRFGTEVEYGTPGHAPHPYMRPAFDRRSPGLDEALFAIADRFPSS